MRTICSTISGATPSLGSSSSTSKGFPISVLATVSICCSPPLMRAPGRSGISPRLGNNSNSAAGVQFGATLPSGQRRGGWRATSRFSNTVRSAKMRLSSGTKPRPAREITCGSALLMSRPMKLTWPSRRASIPIKALSVVLLPAPLRPISATTSPRRTCRSTSNRICAAPYQADSLLASSKTSFTGFMRRPLSRRSCHCRSRPPGPAGRRGSRPAGPARSSDRAPARSAGQHGRTPRPCCAR